MLYKVRYECPRGWNLSHRRLTFKAVRIQRIMMQSKHLFVVIYRDKAEQTIWNRLQQLTAMKKKRLKTRTPMKIGILGKSLYRFTYIRMTYARKHFNVTKLWMHWSRYKKISKFNRLQCIAILMKVSWLYQIVNHISCIELYHEIKHIGPSLVLVYLADIRLKHCIGTREFLQYQVQYQAMC